MSRFIKSGALNIDGIRWVLNYRIAIPLHVDRIVINNYIKNRQSPPSVFRQPMEDVSDHDGHSGGSFSWTMQASDRIDEVGWDRWLMENQGYLSQRATTQ